jgi:hypothetical protein
MRWVSAKSAALYGTVFDDNIAPRGAAIAVAGSRFRAADGRILGLGAVRWDTVRLRIFEESVEFEMESRA